MTAASPTSIRAGSTICGPPANIGLDEAGSPPAPEHARPGSRGGFCRGDRAWVRQAESVRNPMFVPDDRLASLIFDYCRERLSLDPVVLDLPGDKAVLERALAGALGSEPQDPAAVLNLFADHLAPAVISCDSPRFLAF